MRNAAIDLRLRGLIATEILLDEGFEVIDFGCGDHGHAYLVEHAADVRMLFTDVQMPGRLDGVALAHLVAVSWPWITLLVTSGSPAISPDLLPEGATFIVKPWRHADIVAHAHRAQ